MGAELMVGLRIGYAKADITPEEPVPMAGLGNSSQRKNKSVLDHIFATCLALTDQNGDSALFFSIDIQNAYDPVAKYRESVSLATGFPLERIMMCFTHDHSSVDINNRNEASVVRFNNMMNTQLPELAKEALADRQSSQVYISSVKTEGLNFVRRYIMNDGSLCGDNWGSMKSGVRSHETEADHTLQLIKFVRNGADDVLVTNFQTHSNYTIHEQVLSSDVAGAFRDAMEEVSGCKVIHFNGASGNINPKSRVPEENIAADHRDWGKRLAAYAMKAEFAPVSISAIKTEHHVFTAVANHTEDHLVEQARAIVDVFYTTNDRARCRDMGAPYGITSCYHAMGIVQHTHLGETIPVHMFVYSLGKLAFVFAPIEMFDTNGMYIKEKSPFDMTFICGYANYCQGYMPSAIACANRGYEVVTGIFAPGNAEKLADRYVEMLNHLYEE